MTETTALTRMEGKIDGLASDVRQIGTSLTELATRTESWPKVVEQVSDHEKRITTLEAFEVKKYDERLDKLEQTVSGFKGWLAGATAVAVMVGSGIAWMLAKLIPTTVGG